MLDDLAERLATPVVDLPSNFMLDPATYERGTELGFDGLDFYVCGRAGALGEVDAGVVAAAIVFFNPAMIRERWERGRAVMAPLEAAAAFAGCLESWSDGHLEESPDHARLAELLGRVLTNANPAGAPLFAAWLAMPEPAEPAALMMHRLYLLRELRGAMHGCAVLAAGLDPLVALLIRTPFMAPIFGWTEPYPEVDLAREAWEGAEAATNQAVGRMLKVLPDRDREELAELLEQVHAGVH
ncbi:MAG TPA: hypothetical protein VKU92_08375 [Acidimicrobiales bacterium]|nr:hypothetical protein [Acidimicrobiales bacterium]